MNIRRYKVLLEVEISDETKESFDKKDMDDKSYIEEELGWANESFNNSRIANIERIGIK